VRELKDNAKAAKTRATAGKEGRDQTRSSFVFRGESVKSAAEGGISPGMGFTCFKGILAFAPDVL